MGSTRLMDKKDGGGMERVFDIQQAVNPGVTV